MSALLDRLNKLNAKKQEAGEKPTVPSPEPVVYPISSDVQEQPTTDTGNIQLLLFNLAASIQEGTVEPIASQLNVIQAELHKCPYLVDSLEPQDIGSLVKAKRMEMQQDILFNSKPAKRAAGKKAPTLKDVQTASVEDFGI